MAGRVFHQIPQRLQGKARQSFRTKPRRLVSKPNKHRPDRMCFATIQPDGGSPAMMPTRVEDSPIPGTTKAHRQQ